MGTVRAAALVVITIAVIAAGGSASTRRRLISQWNQEWGPYRYSNNGMWMPV